MGYKMWRSISKRTNAITSAHILSSCYSKKPFGSHVDVSELSVGGTLTQTDNSRKDRVLAFFSVNLRDAE